MVHWSSFNQTQIPNEDVVGAMDKLWEHGKGKIVSRKAPMQI